MTRPLAETDEGCRDIDSEYDKMNSDGEDDTEHQTETDGVTNRNIIIQKRSQEHDRSCDQAD